MGCWKGKKKKEQTGVGAKEWIKLRYRRFGGGSPFSKKDLLMDDDDDYVVPRRPLGGGEGLCCPAKGIELSKRVETKWDWSVRLLF